MSAAGPKVVAAIPDSSPGARGRAIARGMVPATPANADVGPVEDAVPPPPTAAPASEPVGRAAASGSSSQGSRCSSPGPSKKGEEEETEDEGAAVKAVEAASSSESEVDELIFRVQQQLSIEEEIGVQLAKEPLMPSFDLDGVAHLIRSGRAKRIICMCGAGISVSAGIPDFRTPGTGLYHRLEEYGLPYPQAVFEIDYFRRNPRPFFLLAKSLMPTNFVPTPTHLFMRLLHDKGLLLRCFTQNIDSLEHRAGLPAEAVVAAHGNFDSARCIRCKRPHDMEHVRAAVMAGDGNPCYCVKKSCGGLVKPDIVFFGENLPARFFELAPRDFPAADLLIVMGTSLVVQPFAGLIDSVGPEVPRLLVNRERAGELTAGMRKLGYTRGFNFGEGNYRDALHLGDCDAGVRKLCQLLGWEQELDALIAAAVREAEKGPAAVEPAIADPAAMAAAVKQAAAL